MKWLKKLFYKKGTGSPGEIAKVFAESFKKYREVGLSEFEASKKVFDEYIRSYEMMGVDVTDAIKNDTVQEAKGDPALVCYSLLIIGNSNNRNAINKIRSDSELIVKLILEEQNKVLRQNRSLQDLEEKHSDF